MTTNGTFKGFEISRLHKWFDAMVKASGVEDWREPFAVSVPDPVGPVCVVAIQYTLGITPKVWVDTAADKWYISVP